MPTPVVQCWQGRMPPTNGIFQVGRYLSMKNAIFAVKLYCAVVDVVLRIAMVAGATYAIVQLF